jgi:hypothetical protein
MGPGILKWILEREKLRSGTEVELSWLRVVSSGGPSVCRVSSSDSTKTESLNCLWRLRTASFPKHHHAKMIVRPRRSSPIWIWFPPPLYGCHRRAQSGRKIALLPWSSYMNFELQWKVICYEIRQTCMTLVGNLNWIYLLQGGVEANFTGIGVESFSLIMGISISVTDLWRSTSWCVCVCVGGGVNINSQDKLAQGRFTHIAFRAHAAPMSFPCHAAKGLECVFPIWFTQCGRVSFTLAMPRPCHALTIMFFSRLRHSTAVERRPVWATRPRSASSG